MEPVPGVQRPEVEMILAALSEQLEQLVEQEGSCDHGRAGIMPEAAPFKHLRPSANGIQPVDKCHGMAPGAHAEGSRDAAETKHIPRWQWAAGARSGRFAEWSANEGPLPRMAQLWTTSQ